MNFLKTFDEELAQILTDYRNQSWTDPETGETLAPLDISQGSMVFVDAAPLASAKWGLHRHQAWIADQMFADKAATVNLEHWCWLRGITRQAGETDAELLARLLADLRNPPAGGNAADYPRWALEVENVDAAWCVPLGNGAGTVDVLILADAAQTGSEIPDSALLEAVHAHIIALCPCEMHPDDLRVLAPAVITQDVEIGISGAADDDELAADIAAFMAAMEPGQTLYTGRLVALAIALGEETATVTTPAANVPAAAGQVIRPGTITVTVT